jgi:HEAT repeat protein
MGWVILAGVLAVVLIVILRGSRGASQNRQGDEAPAPPPWEDLVDPSLKPLVRQLSNDMPLVVAPAAKALGASGHADAVRPLLSILGIEQRSVRFAVVDALVALVPLSVIPLQEALASERDANQRQLMTLILGQLERQAKGLELVPTSELLAPSKKLLDEMARDLAQ